MKNSGELSIRISVESRSIESIPSEEKENYWLKWTECQIPGTISDVYACANWVPEEKKDKEAGKNTWNSKKKKKTSHFVILSSTSKTHHKSQIGKTQNITVNLQEATIKKLVMSKRAREKWHITYRGQTILTDSSQMVNARRHWNSQKAEKIMTSS